MRRVGHEAARKKARRPAPPAPYGLPTSSLQFVAEMFATVASPTGRQAVSASRKRQHRREAGSSSPEGSRVTLRNARLIVSAFAAAVVGGGLAVIAELVVRLAG